MARKCPVCKSRKWHKEPLSGLIVCSEGHVLQNYRNETNETTELGPHALKRRAIKSQRQKKEKISEADPKLYHGDRAKFHYFQCLQLLFRKQVAALITAWALPPEFESICRDTWSLYLTLLPEDIPAEPLNMHASDDNANLEHAPRVSEPSGAKSDGEDAGGSAAGSSASSSSSEDDTPELVELLEEASQSSDSTDAEPAASGSRPHPSRRKRKRPLTHATPAGNIAVLALACWILRIPVIYMDFILLVENHKLPYLEPLHYIPPAMTLHLTKHTVQELTPPFPPDALDLQRMAARLARRLHANYSITIPELNAAPVLWRAVRALNGSPILYYMAKSLATTLDVSLAIHPSLATSVQETSGKPKTHKHDNVAPEVSLSGCVVLALKLMYGLDGEQRHPVDPTDPLSCMPRIEEWMESLRKRNLESEPFSTSSDFDVLDMKTDDLDRYIKFCELALVDPRRGSTERDWKTDFFPMPANRGDLVSQELTFAPFSEFQLTALAAEGENQPAQRHTIYTSLDPNGALPQEYELVLEVAAKWCGVGIEDIGTVIESFERRLIQWWKTSQKEAKRNSGVKRKKSVSSNKPKPS